MPFANGHALIIGSGHYQFMDNYNVPIAIKDAEAVSAALQDAELWGYPAEQVSVLTKDQTTRAAVLSKLDALAGMLKADDTFFLFFVGHGVSGTDGNYYLTTYDTRLQGNQVQPGTGISETDLLGRLRKIGVKRMLLVINACHAGNLSSSFDVGGAGLNSKAPPPKFNEALLGTGEGRITITACRPEQKSWIGTGKLSIFSDALVRGLRGGASNRNGYISAFSLYEYIYGESKEAADELGHQQEAELTVIKGVGPFPVALYQGATAPGAFDVSEEVPAETAARQVSPEKIQRSYSQYQAVLNGDGAIAQGEGAKAVGAGGIMIGGNVSGNITIGNNNRINDR